MWYIKLDCPEDANTYINGGQQGMVMHSFFRGKGHFRSSPQTKRTCIATVQQHQFQGNPLTLNLENI